MTGSTSEDVVTKTRWCRFRQNRPDVPCVGWLVTVIQEHVGKGDSELPFGSGGARGQDREKRLMTRIVRVPVERWCVDVASACRLGVGVGWGVGLTEVGEVGKAAMVMLDTTWKNSSPRC